MTLKPYAGEVLPLDESDQQQTAPAPRRLKAYAGEVLPLDGTEPDTGKPGALANIAGTAGRLVKGLSTAVETGNPIGMVDAAQRTGQGLRNRLADPKPFDVSIPTTPARQVVADIVNRQPIDLGWESVGSIPNPVAGIYGRAKEVEEEANRVAVEKGRELPSVPVPIRDRPVYEWTVGKLFDAVDWGGDAMQSERYKKATAAMASDLDVELEKPFLDAAQGIAKTLKEHPVQAVGLLAESGASMVVPLLAGRTILKAGGKGVYEEALQKGMNEGLAKAAQRTWEQGRGKKLAELTIAGSNVAQVIGSSVDEVADSIAQIPDQDLQGLSPRYAELRTYLDENQARALITRDASAATATTAAFTAGLTNLFTAGLEARIAGAGLGGNARKSIGRDVAGFAGDTAKEGVQETLESGGERLAQNVGMQTVDPNQETWEGVQGEAALGGILGTGMGATVAGAGRVADRIAGSPAEPAQPPSAAPRTVPDSWLGGRPDEAAEPEPVPTVDDIHQLAEQQGIASDNDPAFMDRTERLTGKKHLDDLTPDELTKVADDVRATGQPAAAGGPAAAEPAPATPLEEQFPPDTEDDEVLAAFERLRDQDELGAAVHEAAASPLNDRPEPTEAQKAAGNQKMGHLRVQGLEISIENPAGSRRNPDWEPLQDHYGYIRGTTGADKEHVDVFLGSDPKAPTDTAYVVDQHKADGTFDERKVVLRARDIDHARAIYRRNYPADFTGLKSITAVPTAELKAQLAVAPSQPFADQQLPPLPAFTDGRLTDPAATEQLKRLDSAAPSLAVKQAVRGGPVPPGAQQQVERVLATLDAAKTDMAAQGAGDVDPVDVAVALAEETGVRVDQLDAKDLADAGLVTRAMEIDEVAVDAAATEHADNDGAYMASIRRIIDGPQTRADQDAAATGGGQALPTEQAGPAGAGIPGQPGAAEGQLGGQVNEPDAAGLAGGADGQPGADARGSGSGARVRQVPAAGVPGSATGSVGRAAAPAPVGGGKPVDAGALSRPTSVNRAPDEETESIIAELDQNQGFGTVSDKLTARIKDAEYRLMQLRAVHDFDQEAPEVERRLEALRAAVPAARIRDQENERRETSRGLLKQARGELEASNLSAQEREQVIEAARQSGDVVPAAMSILTAVDSAATAAPSPPERRKDSETRQRVSQMSQAELRRALLVDALTGLGNRRAYDEAERLPIQASIDVDSLKWVNDTMGHDSGDKLLAAVGQAMLDEPNAYHVSGDEFVLEAQSTAAAEAAMERVNARLAAAIIAGDRADGTRVTIKGIGVSYGTGTTLKAAEGQLQANKQERERAGRRAARGQQPPNAVAEVRDGEDQTGAGAEEVGRNEQGKPDKTVRNRKAALDDGRLIDSAFRRDLDAMASEAGWAQIGGQLIRDGEGANAEEDAAGLSAKVGNAVGRTSWVPNAPWFAPVQRDAGLPGNAGGRATAEAVRKALAGEVLSAPERRHVGAMLDWIEGERAEYSAQGAPDINPYDLTGAIASDLEPVGPSIVDAALVARAVELDEDSVERAAIQYGDDDAAFMAAIRGLVSGRKQEVAPNGRGAGAAVDPGGQGVQGQNGARPAGVRGEPAAAQGQVRSEVDEPPLLSSYSADDLAAEAERAAGAERAETARRKKEETRAQADQDALDFRLTGSDQPADVAMAGGQRSFDVAAAGEQRSFLATLRKPDGIAPQPRQPLNTRAGVLSELEGVLGKDVVRSLQHKGLLSIVQTMEPQVAPGGKKLEVRGRYLNGKVTLVAGNLKPGLAYGTFIHELGGHGGIQAVSDPVLLEKINADIDALVAAGDEIAVQAHKYATGLYKGTDKFNNERLAYVVQYAADARGQGKTLSDGIKRLLMKLAAAVRRWLRDKAGMDLRFNANDLLQLAEVIVREQAAAPRGVRGLGQQVAYDLAGQTDTPAFRRWFGRSVVTDNGKPMDEGGKPVVVYHGTRADFDAFKATSGSDLGFHFGTVQQAEGRGGTRLMGATNSLTMPVYLSIKKPLRVTDPGYFGVQDPNDNAFALELQSLGVRTIPGMSNAELIRAIEAAGYDGLVYANEGEGEGDSWAAIRPEQIKSATGNSGSFDPNDPRIQYDLADPETDDDGEEVTAIKNRETARQRELRGFKEADQVAKREFKEVWADAKPHNDQDWADIEALAGVLKQTPRPIFDTEDAKLLHLQIKWQNEHSAVRERLEAIQTEGDQGQVGPLQFQKIELERKLEELYDTLKHVGTANARGLNARRILARYDYSLASMQSKLRSEKPGRLITPEEQKKLEDYDRAIRAAADHEEREAKERTKAEQETDDAAAEVVSEVMHDDAVAEVEADPNKDSPEADKARRSEKKSLDEKLKKAKADGFELRKHGTLIQQLARMLIAAGVRNRDKLIDGVQAHLRDKFDIEMTRREVMDAISGYGDYKLLKKDELSAEERRLKGEMQQVAKIQDILAGKLPAKTGVERREAGEEERRLIAEVNELKRQNPHLWEQARDPAKVLRSALDAVKKRMQNQIQDYTRAVAERKQINRGRTPLQDDAELKQLRATLAGLREDYAKIFPKGKRTLTPEQQQAMAERALERQIEAALLELRGLKPTKAHPKALVSPKSIALRTRLDALRAELELVRGPGREAAEIARLTDDLKALDAKIAAGDLSTKDRAGRKVDSPAVAALKEQRDAKNRALAKLRSAAKEKMSADEQEMNRLVSRMEDIEKSIAAGGATPARADARATESAHIRRLRAEREKLQDQLNEVRKADVARQEKRQLMALNQASAEYERLINANDLALKPKAGPKVETEATKAAKARRDELRKKLNEMREAAGVFDQPRIDAAMKLVAESIADLKQRIADGEVATKERSGLTTPELDALRAEQKALSKVMQKMRRDAMTDEQRDAIALKSIMTRLVNDRLRLLDKIANEDFEDSPRRKVEYSEEAKKVRYDRDVAKREFHKLMMLNRIKNWTWKKKAWNWTKEFAGLPRGLLTMADVSAFLRQGAFIVFGHPIRGVKAARATYKALWSEQHAHSMLDALRNRDNARSGLYERAGLYIADPDAKLSQREEVYMNTWLEKVWGIKHVYKGSERIYTAFLNQLRADSFDAMAESLARTDALTDKEAQGLAYYVNNATGRGSVLGFKGGGEVAAQIFFSPRYVASRFAMASFMPVAKAGSLRASRNIAFEYARFGAGMVVFYGLAALANAAFGDEEDDELNRSGLKVKTGDMSTLFDPRSSDFMKVRIGKLRLDPMAGLSQAVVFSTRFLGGESVTAKGQVKDLDNAGFGQDDRIDVGVKFLRSKLAPVPSAAITVLSGEDFLGRKVDLKETKFNVADKTISATDMAYEMMAPMSIQTILEITGNSWTGDKGVNLDPEAQVALIGLSLLGMGVSVYE